MSLSIHWGADLLAEAGNLDSTFTRTWGIHTREGHLRGESKLVLADNTGW